MVARGSIPACAGKPWPSGGREHPGLRSIPACAGKPSIWPAAGYPARVHPRVCGEALPRRVLSRGLPGPSPRVRGSRGSTVDRRLRQGSIPACAGKPICRVWLRIIGSVHPRVCGKPTTRRAAPAPMRVHPRVCGEASPPAGGDIARLGPSPRVRGSHDERLSRDVGERSIPACAGKPSIWPVVAYPARVHPRVCGEAGGARGVGAGEWGPSPRVRGSLGRDAGARADRGSIPACAGKPSSTPAQSVAAQVHPRVCGEAPASAALPPSRRVHPRVCGEAKPKVKHRYMPRGPSRVCGEATAGSRGSGRWNGPSPRVRGSLREPSRSAPRDRSIPRVRGSLCQITDGNPARFNCPSEHEPESQQITTS